MEIETLFVLKKPHLYVDANLWTKKIGLTPLRCVLKGDPMPESSQIVSPDSMWIFGVLRREEPSAESQIISVVDQVYAKKNDILRLVHSYNLVVSCETSVWFGDENSFVDFGHDIFKKLSELGASFQLKYCV